MRRIPDRHLWRAWRTTIAALTLTSILAAACVAQDKEGAAGREKRFRGLLGPNNNKVKVEGGKTFLWAKGKRDGPDAQWYDFTDSLVPAAELQFGIGKDSIPAIDDPFFVSPDDPRLLKFGRSHYRRDEIAKTNNEIRVIGYADGDDVRAYPVALLDRHELVNDEIGGKPVTVGW